MSNCPVEGGNPAQEQGMQMGKPDVSKDANSVPGFPQDAFMEGPMMAMDQMVDKPENFGLRPGWSGFMAGIMEAAPRRRPDKNDQNTQPPKKQESTKATQNGKPREEDKQ